MSFLRVLIVCALGANASITQAGLTHVNDDAFAAMVLQENEVTRDSATNLDWLDIDAYTEISYDYMTILLANDSILDGWRHATLPDVVTFFDHLGLGSTIPTVNNDGGTLGSAAAAYVGISFSLNADTQLSHGFTSTESAEDFVWRSYFWSGSASAGGSDTNRQSVLTSNVNSGVGHWLVQTTPSQDNIIPEPSTFSMLAFCGLAMAGYTRLRRRRK